MSSFKAFGKVVELGFKPTVEVSRLNTELNRLFIENPFLRDYYVKKGPEAVLQLIFELHQYYKNDPLLDEVKIFASVMTREAISEETQIERLKQSIDFYCHFEIVSDDRAVIVESQSTSLIKKW